MNSVVLFGGPQALDFLDVRSNLIRIPEVRARLDEAQKIWDQNVETVIDFHQLLCSDDRDFFSNISLKSLCSAIVQVGLYDRLQKLGHAPRFLIGDCRNDSALKVVAGVITMKDLVLSSRAAGLVRPLAPVAEGALPFLNGQNFALYEVLERQTTGDSSHFVSTQMQDMDLSRLIKQIYDRHSVRQLIAVGPGRPQISLTQVSALSEVQVSESIDLDPLLSWFWREIAS